MILVALLVACFVTRLAIAWRLPNIHQPDEIYQVPEQAFRAVNGYGIVPWEFRTASRATLLPTVIEPIYRLPIGAAAHRVLSDAFFCLVSLICVWVAFRWAGRLFGLAGAIVAAIVMGTWFELVYFAPKATTDAVGGYLLLAGAYLARPDGRPAAAFGAGLTLILALAVRVQIAPAILVVLLLALLVPGRARTIAILAGAALALAIAGSVEWRWWGRPFQGQIGYLMMEFTRHSSRYFGREPLIFYIKQYVLMYGLALPVIAFLVYQGSRKAPVLLIIALAVILPFHFVGHKEYRFVIAALPVLVLLMGLGASELIAAINATRSWMTPALILGGWIVAMLAASFSDTYRPYWTRHGNHILAFEEVGRQNDACGIALVGMDWAHTPGYSGLGKEIPIYQLTPKADAARILAAANYVLAGTTAEPPPAPYERWRAYTRPVQYLYRRLGTCVPDPSIQIVRPPGIPGIE